MKIITDKLSETVEKYITENEKLGTILIVVILILKFMNFNDKKIEDKIKGKVK